MGFTISKRKQPVNSSFMKNGQIFYRVKSAGVYMNDLKQKQKH